MWLCLKWVLPPNFNGEEYVTMIPMMMNYVYFGAFSKHFKTKLCLQSTVAVPNSRHSLGNMMPTLVVGWQSVSNGTMKKNGAVSQVWLGLQISTSNDLWSTPSILNNSWCFPHLLDNMRFTTMCAKNLEKSASFEKVPAKCLLMDADGVLIFSGWLFTGRLTSHVWAAHMGMLGFRRACLT